MDADAADRQRHRGTRAIQRMVEYAPSTGGLALWVHHHDLGDAVADAPLVATDGHTLFYDARFDTLPLAEQAGHVAHEVLHIALRHAQRYLDLQSLLGDVDLPLFNTCADAIVNSTLAHLSWLQLPAGAVRLDRLLAATLAIDEPVDKSLLEWDVERLYRALDDRKQGGRRAAQTRALGGQARDNPLDLQPRAAARSTPEQEAEQAREWRERIVRAHAGDGAHSMLRALVADLPRIHTPWEQILRRQLARSLAPKLDVSWSRPSRSYLANQGRCGPGRRMPFEPGTSPLRAVPRLAVVVDVSGSIDDALMARFAREIEAITRRLGSALTLVVGDDRVRRVESFAPGRSALREIDFDGGGGTDFTPLLEAADEHRPDVTVVLTDLDGPARFRPRAPVIWAVPPAHADAVAPFGRTLVLRP